MIIFEVENISTGTVIEDFDNEEEAVKFAEKRSSETGHTYLVTPKEARYEV